MAPPMKKSPDGSHDCDKYGCEISLDGQRLKPAAVKPEPLEVRVVP
jgi:hypothetical protein